MVMERVILALALVAVAVAVAYVLQRRTRPADPAKGRTWTVPGQLHRPDFIRPDIPLLAVLFSSSTCDSCAATWEKVSALASEQIAVQVVPWQERRALHERYGIDAVPTVLIADADGVVTASFVGEPSVEDLRMAVSGVEPR